MTHKIGEFESILKAIQSTYSVLQEEEHYSEIAMEKLKEAEELVTKAIEYKLQYGNL